MLDLASGNQEKQVVFGRLRYKHSPGTAFKE